MISIQLLIINYLCVLFLIVALYLFVTWPKTEKLSLSGWEILTLLISSILINQLVGSYQAHIIVYFANAIILSLLLIKFSNNKLKHEKSHNELTRSINKIKNFNDKTFEKFIISLLKKYSFQSISKFDVKDDADNISDNYLLAQREGVFYEIRTIATKTELSENHINNITSKYRDSPTQIDRRILFINSGITNHVKHLIDHSGITINTIDLPKIKDLIKVVEPTEEKQSSKVKTNIANSIDILTGSLNSLKEKLVGVDTSTKPFKSIEEALNETIIKESKTEIEGKADPSLENKPSESIDKNQDDTTTSSDDLTSINKLGADSESKVESISVENDSDSPNNTDNTDNTDNTETNATVKSNESDDIKPNQNEDESDEAESDEAESDEAESDENGLDSVSEDEINSIEIEQPTDFDFNEVFSDGLALSPHVENKDKSPTEIDITDADIFGDSNLIDDDLLNLNADQDQTDTTDIQPDSAVATAQNTSIEDDALLNPIAEQDQTDTTDIQPDSAVAAAQNTSIEDDALLNPIAKQDQTDTTDIQPDSAVEDTQDSDLAFILAAQTGSLHDDNFANFDDEGNLPTNESPTSVSFDYPDDDTPTAPFEMTEDDLRTMAMLDDDGSFDNEIKDYNSDAALKFKFDTNKNSTFDDSQTGPIDVLSDGKAPTTENQTVKPKKRRPRGKKMDQ